MNSDPLAALSISEFKGEASPSIYADWWMEIYFRNLTAKVWANLDNPIIRYFFFLQWFHSFGYVALSGGTLLISVMSQQYNCLMELYTIFKQNCILFMKMYLPSSLIIRYVRAEMNVHAFMNNFIKRDYWVLISKKKKMWKSLYNVNGELSSCDITYSDIHNFA